MLGSKKFSASPGEPVLLVNNQKTIVNYVPVLIQNPTQAYATVQPYKPKELLLSPIDQRSWGHYKFFVQIPDWMNQQSALNPPIEILNTANQIYWQGNCYKILSYESWQQTNGFVKYEALKDFQNSPNIVPPPTSWVNGIALCDIISEFFGTQSQSLMPGQIFLMNSNYTPSDLTSFLIVVQLNKIEAYGFGGIPSVKTSATTATETIVQKTKEYYTIEIVSSDGSAIDAVPLVSLALQGERDYVLQKQTAIGFNLADISEATNISSTTGGTTCTRFRIKVELLSSRTAIISNVQTYSTINLSTWFNQN